MKRAAILGCLAVAFAAWWFARPDQAARPAHDEELLFDRVWLDSKPVQYTDYVHVFFAVSGAPIGIFQKASSYDIHAEIYEYSRRGGGVLSIHFPQSKRTAKIRYRVHRCDELPPFDLCLDLDANPWGGPRRYYGLRDRDDEGRVAGRLRARLEAITATR